MIDFWNAVAIALGCLVVGGVLVSLREKRKKGTVGMVAAFIIGLAFHSVYLHEKVRHRWRHPWNHAEKN